MGLFRKKKRMIDVRELQRRGMVRLPVQRNDEVATDNDGFVEIGSSSSGLGLSSNDSFESMSTPKPTVSAASTSSGSSSSSSDSSSGVGDFFNFMDNSSSNSSAGSSSGLSSTTTPSEDLRKISAQLSELDNKLYKLEQRIELVERKMNV